MSGARRNWGSSYKSEPPFCWGCFWITVLAVSATVAGLVTWYEHLHPTTCVEWGAHQRIDTSQGNSRPTLVEEKACKKWVTQ